MFEKGIEKLLHDIKETPDYIIAIPRGGLVLGVRLSHEFDRPLAIFGTDSMGKYDLESPALLVDDISDTGKALLAAKDKMYNRNLKTVALYIKPKTLYVPDYYVYSTESWLVFPWERKEEDSVKARWAFG